MRWLTGLLLALLAAAGLALLLRGGSGYLLLQVGEWTIETSAVVAAIVLALLVLAIYLLLRLLFGLGQSTRALRGWRDQRKLKRARNHLHRGLIALAEGRWESAEKLLLRNAGESEIPLINYLAAARCAQALGVDARRDHYLQQAAAKAPDAELAIGLTQAVLQLDHRQYEQALATLKHLRSSAPKHQYVLKLLIKLYRQLQDWEHLRELLPAIGRSKLLDGSQMAQLEQELYSALLERAGRQQDLAQLEQCWGHTPNYLRREASMLFTYARQLFALDQSGLLEAPINEALERNWSSKLAYLYGLVETPDSNRQLHRAERWLKSHPDDAGLLLSLGRIALRAQLWGKARSYLEASIDKEPSIEAWRELGALLEALGEEQAALGAYRQMAALSGHASQEQRLGTKLPRALPAPALPSPDAAHNLLAEPTTG